MSVQLGCVISGLQLWGQPEEPSSSDRSQQGQQRSCEKELCRTGNSGKGERFFCVVRSVFDTERALLASS